MKNFKVMRFNSSEHDFGLESIMLKISKRINDPKHRSNFKRAHPMLKSAHQYAFDNITGIYIAGGAARDVVLERTNLTKDLDIYIMVDPKLYDDSLRSVSHVDYKKAVDEKADESAEYHNKSNNYCDMFNKLTTVVRRYIEWTIHQLHTSYNTGPGEIYNRDWVANSISVNGKLVTRYSSAIFNERRMYIPTLSCYNFLGYSVDNSKKEESNIDLYGMNGTRLFDKVLTFVSDVGPANYDKIYDLSYALANDIIINILINCEYEHRHNFLKGKREKKDFESVAALCSAYRSMTDHDIAARELRSVLMYFYRMVLNEKSHFTNQLKQLKEITIYLYGALDVMKNVLGENLEKANETTQALRELFGLTGCVSHVMKSVISHSAAFSETSVHVKSTDIDMMIVPDFAGAGGISEYIDRFFDLSLSKCYIEEGKARYSQTFQQTLETKEVVYESSRTDLLMKRNILHTSRIMRKLGYEKMTMTSESSSTQFLPPKNTAYDSFMTKMFMNYLKHLQIEEYSLRKKNEAQYEDPSEAIDTSAFVI